MELRFACRATQNCALKLNLLARFLIFLILNIICEIDSWKCLLYDMLNKLAENIPSAEVISQELGEGR